MQQHTLSLIIAGVCAVTGILYFARLRESPDKRRLFLYLGLASMTLGVYALVNTYTHSNARLLALGASTICVVLAVVESIRHARNLPRRPPQDQP